MIVNVMERDGSVSTSIPLLDIDRIETRTLSFFEEKSHNFYLFMKKEQGGYFVLITYHCPLNMEQARSELQRVMQRKKLEADATQTQVFELFPFAAPAAGLVDQA